MPFTPNASTVSYVSLGKSKDEGELDDAERRWVVGSEHGHFVQRLVRKEGPASFQLGGKAQECILVTDSDNNDLYQAYSQPNSQDLLFVSFANGRTTEVAKLHDYMSASKKDRSKCHLALNLPSGASFKGKLGDFLPKAFACLNRSFKTSAGDKYRWEVVRYELDRYFEYPTFWQCIDKGTKQVLCSTERIDLRGRDGVISAETTRHPVYLTEAGVAMQDLLIVTMLLVELLA